MRLTYFVLIFLLTIIILDVAQSEKFVKRRRIKKIIPWKEDASDTKGELFFVYKTRLKAFYPRPRLELIHFISNF